MINPQLCDSCPNCTKENYTSVLIGERVQEILFCETANEEFLYDTIGDWSIAIIGGRIFGYDNLFEIPQSCPFRLEHLLYEDNISSTNAGNL